MKKKHSIRMKAVKVRAPMAAVLKLARGQQFKDRRRVRRGVSKAALRKESA